jgi:hypothetical protein
MRKLMWYGATLAVFAAATAYLAADYASRYPYSMVGRCLVTSYHLGTEYNPVYRLGTGAARSCCKVMSQALPRQAAAPAPAAAAEPAHPAAVCPKTSPVPMSELVEWPQAISPHVVIHDEDEVTPPAGGAEEAESGVPATMPHVEECDPTPRTMPKVETRPGTEDEKAFYEMWMKLLQNETVPCNPEGLAPCEQPMPKCEEDPDHVYETPACPSMGGCCPHSGYNPHAGYCPYSGKCVTDEPSKPHCEKTDPSEVQELLGGDVEEQPAPKKAPEPMDGIEPECQKPGIDTMECRPSDLGRNRLLPPF